MRHKIGKAFMFLGTALIVGALALFIWNNHESSEAESQVSEILPQIHQKVLEARTVLQEIYSAKANIEDSSSDLQINSPTDLPSENHEEDPGLPGILDTTDNGNSSDIQVSTYQTYPYDIIQNTPVEFLTEEQLKMTEVKINGNSYIGYITIPDLNLELPVMANWNYSQLRISPCRYAGSVRGKDMVILAHNYKSHFGNISKLRLGDNVYFTDMDGNVWSYEIVATDILGPYDVEEMMSGEYDLTLFTCTPGGSYRVTVRCMQI